METVDLLRQKDEEEILDQDELQTLKAASVLQQAFNDRKRKHVLFATSTDEGKLACQTYHDCLFCIDLCTASVSNVPERKGKGSS